MLPSVAGLFAQYKAVFTARSHPARTRAASDRDMTGAYLIGVMLDPARPGKMLRDLPIAASRDAAVFAYDEGRRARGSLVNREYVSHH